MGAGRLLRVAGVPVGREIADLMPGREGGEGMDGVEGEGVPGEGGRDGSIIVVVATDAPLMPHQLERMARRVSMGMARNRERLVEQLRGYLRGLLDGESEGCVGTGDIHQCPGDGQWTADAALRGHCRGDGGGDHQRAGGGRDDDRGERRDGACAAA